MCGGEIVDEKWKLSFQGALSSTVALLLVARCRAVPTSSAKELNRASQKAVDTVSPPNLGNRMQSTRSDLHAGIQIAYASSSARWG